MEKTVRICDRYGNQNDVQRIVISVHLEDADEDAFIFLQTADLSERARTLLLDRIQDTIGPVKSPKATAKVCDSDD